MKSIFAALLVLFAVQSEASTVCMVGDSITARGQAWRGYMQQNRPEWSYLGNYSDELYLHDGVGGDTTRDIKLRVGTVPLCDITFLMAGGNDLAQMISTPGKIIERLQYIADTLKAAGSTVYVLTLIPCNCGSSGNAEIVYTNNLLKSNLTGHPIIDTWSAYVNSGYDPLLMFADSVHPSLLGYFVLANYITPRVP